MTRTVINGHLEVCKYEKFTNHVYNMSAGNSTVLFLSNILNWYKYVKNLLSFDMIKSLNLIQI